MANGETRERSVPPERVGEEVERLGKLAVLAEPKRLQAGPLRDQLRQGRPGREAIRLQVEALKPAPGRDAGRNLRGIWVASKDLVELERRTHLNL